MELEEEAPPGVHAEAEAEAEAEAVAVATAVPTAPAEVNEAAHVVTLNTDCCVCGADLRERGGVVTRSSEGWLLMRCLPVCDLEQQAGGRVEQVKLAVRSMERMDSTAQCAKVVEAFVRGHGDAECREEPGLLDVAYSVLRRAVGKSASPAQEQPAHRSTVAVAELRKLLSRDLHDSAAMLWDTLSQNPGGMDVSVFVMLGYTWTRLFQVLLLGANATRRHGDGASAAIQHNAADVLQHMYKLARHTIAMDALRYTVGDYAIAVILGKLPGSNLMSRLVREAKNMYETLAASRL